MAINQFAVHALQRKRMKTENTETQRKQKSEFVNVFLSQKQWTPQIARQSQEKKNKKHSWTALDLLNSSQKHVVYTVDAFCQGECQCLEWANHSTN